MTSFDADAFRDFERAAHGSKAASYHDRFSAVTDRAIEPLLDAAKVGLGTRLLDVASGPGLLAQRAAQRGANSAGVDIAPAMVLLATKLHPLVPFRVAKAEQLPFDDRSFNAVTCAFGIGHFPEPERVVAECVRVLMPGGIVAFAWWDGFARNRINGVFHETIQRLKISAPGAVPPGPPMDQFSDRERFAQLLRAAGLNDVRVDEVSFTYPLRDADDLWDMAMGSFARASTVIGAQSETVQVEIKAAVGEAASQYKTANGLEIPVAFLVASGRK